MKFQKDDLVVHEVYGVGKILGVEELGWMDPDSSHFYVVGVGDAKIWVPVEKQEECHLRTITPKEELSVYQEIFKDNPAKLEENRFGRTNYINQSQKHATFKELCETVRDLTSHGMKRKLAKNEASFLERVTKQLVEEWSLSAEISLKQAESKVKNLLSEIPAHQPAVSRKA